MSFCKAPAFCRRFLLAIPFILLFIEFPLLSRANDEPDEIAVYVSLQKMGMYIPALLQEETLYLPVSDVFNFLKIDNHQSADGISGFFIDPKNRFRIDYVQQRIQYKDTSFSLTGKELIRTATNLYLRSDFFGKVFGLECSFQYRNLAVVINTKLDLPLLRELRQQLLHRNLKIIKEEITPDTTIRHQFTFLRLGTADWAVTHTKEFGGNATTRMNVRMGALLAGGEAVASLQYDNNIPFAQQRQHYQWRFVNNDLKAFKQLILGNIAAHSTASVFAPVRGVQLTNTPTYRRKSFGTYILSDHTQPGWTVELYINNVLTDFGKADASGFFTFSVPLMYGNTAIKLKFFGPSGEERSSEKEIRIPFTMLPAHTFEYTLNAGIVQDSLRSRMARASFQYGLTGYVTLGGGFEYLSSVKTGSRMPFFYTTVKLPGNALFSSEYTKGVRWKSQLTWQQSSRIQLELQYLKYTKGQRAIITTYLEERKAALSLPYRKKDFLLLSKLAVGQVVMPAIGYDSLIKMRYQEIPKANRTTAELTLSAVVRRLNANLTTAGFFHNHSNAFLYSNLSLSYRFPQGLSFRPQLQYNYSQERFIHTKLEVEKQLSNQGFVNLSYARDFSAKISTIMVGLRYNISFLRTAVTAVRSRKTTTLVQSVGGSLLADGSTGFLVHSNRNHTGRGSIVMIPFLDINCNGKRDGNEPYVRGLKFRIRGGRVLADEQDAVIRIVDLEPYSNYLIELDENSFGNISWQIKNKKISVMVEPNTFKQVEVPVAVSGEASGTVFFQSEKEQKGLSRILVNFYDSAGKLAAQTMTESDGYFSYLGLAPGSYTARIDTAQLAVLHFSSSPSALTFHIAGSEEGVVADGFTFLLQARKQDSVNKHRQEQPAGERLPLPEKKQNQNRPESNQPVTLPLQQSPNISSMQPSAEQEQKGKAPARQQQKTIQVLLDTTKRISRAEHKKQTATDQQLLHLKKDSSMPVLQQPAQTNSTSENKNVAAVQKKAVVVPGEKTGRVNQRLRLEQQQVIRQADQVFKKERELQQKRKRLLAEQKRLLAEQKRLRREIQELKMKLKQASSK